MIATLSLLAVLAIPACTGAPYAELDFWVGEWDVFVGERIVGSNRIEKTLDGCAVLEHWQDAGGREGKSLFYISAPDGPWKQVWVADGGAVKEKQLLERLADGGLRFQGRLVHATTGAPYLDRTTLTPRPDGRVRQLIEISTDEGATWQPTFDAVYVRRDPPVGDGPRDGATAPAAVDAQEAPAYQRCSEGTRSLRGAGGLAIEVLLENANFGGAEVEVAELTLPPSPNAGLHRHGSSEILYVLSGELEHVVNDTTYVLRPGMLGVVRPNDRVAHRVRASQPVRALVVWVPGGEADRLARLPAFEVEPIRGAGGCSPTSPGSGRSSPEGSAP